MGFIVTRIKRLRRTRTFLWTGDTRRMKNGISYRVQILFDKETRSFYGVYQRRMRNGDEMPSAPLETDQVEYLRSLLTPEDMAMCVAAGIFATVDPPPPPSMTEQLFELQKAFKSAGQDVRKFQDHIATMRKGKRP